MQLQEFSKIIHNDPNPVILLEGMRALPDSDRETLTTLGRMLTEQFPHARFRTGNAEGTDEAFALGVAAVDAARLEYILPYAGHRKKTLAKGARHFALQDAPEAEEIAEQLSLQSSPQYGTLMEKRTVVPKLRAKANYILRDTVKVIGAPEQGLHPATIGLFYANPDDPMLGGTGHTIRVCRNFGIPAIFQNDWLGWIEEKNM